MYNAENFQRSNRNGDVAAHRARSKIDAALLRFVNADEDVSADEALVEVYSLIVEPIISGVLRRRLYTARSGAERAPEDINDLSSEIRLRLIPVLRRMRKGFRSDIHQVSDFQAYVRSVTLNTFRQFLRDKYPLRLRLKNKIRYIVNHHPEFAAWIDTNNSPVLGLQKWKANGAAADRLEVDEEILTAVSIPGAGSGRIDDNRRILAVVYKLFDHVGGPILVEDAVALVGKCLGVRDPTDSDDAELLEAIAQSSVPGVEKSFEDRESLARLWDGIAALPIRHRRSVLLNLRGANGENALAFFLILQIASIRTISSALEMEDHKLAELWERLPLEDSVIAEMFGQTRQQVINLRQSARSMLKRECS